MSSLDRYARLQTLGRPVLTTGEAGAVWEASLPTAAHTLARLAATGLVTKLRHGVWQVVSGPPDPATVLPVLTNPYPAYISGWSALATHGMVDQIPRSVFAVSLDRTKTIETTSERFEVHHIHPDLFGGFEGSTGTRAGMATPAKALFDTVYLFSARNGHVTLPEIELPSHFNVDEIAVWIAAIPSARLRTMTEANLTRIVGLTRNA